MTTHQPPLDPSPATDPSKNVLDMLRAEIARQDYMREMESRHIRELWDFRWKYDDVLRDAESARLDSIRLVDQASLQRANEVQMAQAAALAAAQSTMAETLRAQAAASHASSESALKAALGPLQEAIADLRRAQYEAAGVRANVGEGRQSIGTTVSIAVAVLILLGLIVNVAVALAK